MLSPRVALPYELDGVLAGERGTSAHDRATAAEPTGAAAPTSAVSGRGVVERGRIHHGTI